MIKKFLDSPHRFLVGFLLVFTMLCYSCCALQRTEPIIDLHTDLDAVEGSLRATVAFVRPQTSGTGTTYCSGFFVSETRIISAGHCFQTALRIPVPDGTFIELPGINDPTGEEVFFARYGEIDLFTNQVIGEPEQANIIYFDREYDVAILELASNVPHSRYFFPFAVEIPRVGSAAYGVGHPSRLPWSFSSGIISRVITESGDRTAFLQSSVPTVPGNSGGPLLNSRGELIGMAEGFIDRFPHLAIFTSVDRIRSAMRSSWRRQATMALTEALGASHDPNQPSQNIDAGTSEVPENRSSESP
ncbi:MAG: serine protease [Candidatus Paceibacterota bacterium]|jgi:S1-C subfamily serine protease